MNRTKQEKKDKTLKAKLRFNKRKKIGLIEKNKGRLEGAERFIYLEIMERTVVNKRRRKTKVAKASRRHQRRRNKGLKKVA